MEPRSRAERHAALHERIHAIPDRVRQVHAGAARELPHLGIGIFLTLLGVVLTLDRLEVVDAARALRWWPMGFHVLGATILLRRQDRHGRIWGIGWLVVGTWLLLNSLRVVRVGFWELFWPGLLIFIGVRLMMRGRAEAVEASGAAGTAASPHLFAILSEARNAVTQPIASASLTAVMGGCRLDLRRASGAGGQPIVVDVFALMGGQEIIVPPGWTVIFDVVTILAGAEDKRLPTLAADTSQAAQVLHIRGTLIFSGLTLKN